MPKCFQVPLHSLLDDGNRLNFSHVLGLAKPVKIKFNFYKGCLALSFCVLRKKHFFFPPLFRKRFFDDISVLNFLNSHDNNFSPDSLFQDTNLKKSSFFSQIRFSKQTRFTISLHDFNEDQILNNSLESLPAIIKAKEDTGHLKYFDNSYLISLLSLFIGFRATGSVIFDLKPTNPKKTKFSVIPMFKTRLTARVAHLSKNDASTKSSYRDTCAGILDIIKSGKFRSRKRTNVLTNLPRQGVRFILFWRKFHANFPFDILVHRFLNFSLEDLPSISNNFLTLVSDESSELLTDPDCSQFVDRIPIGYQICEGVLPLPIQTISLEDLSSHISCFGLTSQGKSRFIYHFISQLPNVDIKFLVFDSKGEYIQPAQKFGFEYQYFKVGSSEFPIQLDIFEVPDGLNTDEHLNFLYSLFLQVVGDSTTPQMTRLIYLAIEEVLKINGSFNDFIAFLENPSKLGLIGAHLELSSSGIMNRILPLTTGVAGSCFNTSKSNVNFQEIISNNVIVDLSPFEDIEHNSARKIFINVLYYYLINFVRRQRAKVRQPGDIQNVIVVEEAQKILPASFEGKTEIRSMLGMSAWTTRAYGISMVFVGTDPVLESSILSNTGVSIIFYSKSEPYQISKALNISFEEYEKNISFLRNRQFFLLSNKSKIRLCRSFDIVV